MNKYTTPVANEGNNMQPSNKPMSSYPIAFKHELHLKGPVTDQEDYVDWIQAIRNAGPNDMIEFHINSPGGNVYTAIEILNAFENTEAHVHVVCSGIIASAGTILMTVGDSFEIHPSSTFMFHNYSGGTIGKGNEMAIKMEYEREWSRKFMSDIYTNILTDDEIDQLLDGRDFWLSAPDVGERLTNMVDKKAEAVQAAMEEIMKAMEEEAKPKRKPRKKPAAKKVTKDGKDNKRTVRKTTTRKK